MPNSLRPIKLLILLLILGLVGCSENSRQSGTGAAVVVTSPQPPTPAAPTDLAQPATAAAVEPNATPTRPAGPSPSPPPSATATMTATRRLAETASRVLPTATPTAPPQPSPTHTPAPTTPPRPSPIHTAAPTARPTEALNDPASIRIGLQPVAGGLETPVGVANAGDGSGRLFILEKVGRIRVLRNETLTDTAFLDITERVGSRANEQGLLGLAFHPNYENNGFFFVNYTDRQGDTVVARFSVSRNIDLADPLSETVILRLEQPAENHNGGHLAFGPDGYLYIGTGDGGAANDRFGNGQNGGTLLGAMLRLDVDGAQPYAIPPDNPFAGDADVRDEIWATGLRNPWRYSFDRLTGDLYIADVGENRYEEVNQQQANSAGGQNYGWPLMEATHCFPENQPCDQAGLALPVAEFDHGQGCSVTGGYVYRGQEFPALAGIYLYGDFCSGRIWGMVASPAGTWQVAELGQEDVLLTSFGEDEAGELYLLDMERGDLHQLTASPR